MENAIMNVLGAAVVAAVASQGMAAIYNGADTSAPLADLTGMTYSCTVPASWSGNSADGGVSDAALVDSNFLDGNRNHANNTADALAGKAPVGAASHWSGTGPLLSATWTMDLKQIYSIAGMTMYGSSGNGYWGMLSTVIDVSADGVNWTRAGSAAGVKYGSTGAYPANTLWEKDEVIVTGTQGRYVRITATDMTYSGNMKLDEFDLFIAAVPEPAALGMMGLGMAAIAWRRK